MGRIKNLLFETIDFGWDQEEFSTPLGQTEEEYLEDQKKMEEQPSEKIE
jgi:hypothetical protein